MSISFMGYVFNTNENTWDLPAGTHDCMRSDMAKPANMTWDEYLIAEPSPNPFYNPDLDVNLANANAQDIFRMLGVSEDSPCMPIAQFVNLVANARRQLLANPSQAIEASQEQGNGPTILHFGRQAGYLEAVLLRLTTLAYAFKKYGATHIGWG